MRQYESHPDCRAAAPHVNSTKWTVESLYPGSSPPILAPLTDVPARPYAMLDYLWLVAKKARILAFLTDGCIYRHRFASQFHERQKMLIRIVNAMNHAGKIKSDYPGDTTNELIIGSGQRSAQIDHVFPYSAYGGNLFSNALVASGAYNNAMKASTPSVKWGIAAALICTARFSTCDRSEMIPERFIPMSRRQTGRRGQNENRRKIRSRGL